MKKSQMTIGAAVFSALLVAGVFFLLQTGALAEENSGPVWVERAGEGLVGPACASVSVGGASCSGSSGFVPLSWNFVQGPADGEIQCTAVTAYLDGAQVDGSRGRPAPWWPWAGYGPCSASVTAGPLSNGAHTFQVVDPSGVYSALTSFSVSCAPPPPSPTADLKVNGSDGPVTISGGSTFSFVWNSTNASSCNLFSDGVPWSGNPHPASGNIVGGPLTSGATYSLTCSGAGGSASDSVRVNVSAPQPDLVAESPTHAPASPVAGQAVTFSGVIRNGGLASAGASTARLRIDPNNNGWAAGEPEFTTPQGATGALASGASEAKTWSGIWTAVAGTHRYEICADSANVVAENSENNNCTPAGSGVFTVSAQTLGVTLDPIPSGPAPLNATLTANATGNTIGTTIYSFWWNCANTSPSVATAEGACGRLPAAGLGACASDSVGTKCMHVTATTQATPHTYASPGPYTAKVIAERGSAPAAEARQSFTVAAAFDYTLSNSGNISVVRGSAGSNSIARTIVSGTAEPVTLSASGLPAGASASFTANPCSPICSSALTISTTAATPAGTFPITVTGAPLGRTTAFNLTVTIPAQCTDGIDNDGDGLVDSADPGCLLHANDERNVCTDGIDNDGDGVIDHTSVNPPGGALGNPDSGCSSPQDNTEADPPRFCEVNPDDPNAVCL